MENAQAHRDKLIVKYYYPVCWFPTDASNEAIEPNHLWWLPEATQAMPKKGKLIAVAGIAASFAALVGVIVFLWKNKIITAQMATLMLVALFGLYFGFGVLIAVYRLVAKLD